MLMLECDIYYHKEMLACLLDGKGECSILVSPFNPKTMDGSVINIDGDIAQGLVLGNGRTKDLIIQMQEKLLICTSLQKICRK